MTRMISVSDQTYEKLQKIKGGKSFSRLLDELAEQKKNRILQFAGLWKDSWKDRGAVQFVAELRKEGGKEYQKRWKRIEKKWKE